MKYEDPLVQSPAINRDIFQLHHVALSPINLILKISRDEATTTSLDNLFQCFSIFKIKNAFLFCSLKICNELQSVYHFKINDTLLK